MLPLVLASASPRRRELLERVGLELRVVPPHVDETPRPDDTPEDTAERLARLKVDAVAVREPDRLVVGADTIVVRDGRLLGKPRDEDEAVRMLEALADRTHQVITGWAVRSPSGQRSGTVTTHVRFRPLSRPIIDRYVATGEPADKAGAYGIQGAGAMLVRSIEGSYTNVVGLPLVEVLDAIAALGGPRL